MKVVWVTFVTALFIFCFCVSCMDSTNNIPFIIGMLASGGYMFFIGQKTNWLGSIK